MGAFDNIMNGAKELAPFDKITDKLSNFDTGKLADGVKGFVKNGIDDAFNDFVNNNEFDTPDYSRFMNVVQSRDLARTNLFLVKFQDFRSLLMNDSITDVAGDIFSDVTNANGITGMGKALYNGISENVNWERATQLGFRAIRKKFPSAAGKIDKFDPTLIRMIPGLGEFYDGIVDAGYDPNKDLAIMVKSVSLPGVSLDTQKNFTNRKPFTEVNGRSYSNLRMTFYSTPEMREREWFINWMRDIHNPDTNQVGFYNAYSKVIDTTVLDRQGNVRAVIHCDGCFPISVGDIQLDYENNNQIMTFDVEFTISTMKQSGKMAGNLTGSFSDIVSRGKNLGKSIGLF
ncbi:hypothetical protein ACKC5Q_05075 [Aeromonas dhakensis]|uniref:hypothetical protein n=1 Tax=Aeromonas dhakensis TaxID=196024 RepID=UPI0038B6B191